MFNKEKLDGIKQRFDALGLQIADTAVISDTKEWTKLVKEHTSLGGIVEVYEKWLVAANDLSSAEQLLSSDDAEMRELARLEVEEKRNLCAKLEDDLKVLLLPKDPDDDRNVIIEIRGGAGGEEAALFGADLMRMYKMYADRNRWTVEDLTMNMTELGGVKEAVFSLSGKEAFSRLKFESGVHRVQRVPETETQGRIHTSTVTVAVLPEAEDVNVEILDKDLKIDTYRSGGAGGQHINKTDSAVRMTHLPTGIVVCCEDERSQMKNRDKAMKVLKARVYDYYSTRARDAYAGVRRLQIGTGDRSERIRTYNFPQGRVTDHRIGVSMYNIVEFMNGNIDEMLDALKIADITVRLSDKTV